MRSHPHRPSALTLAAILFASQASCADEAVDLSAMLRDALYAEEVSRDPEKAAHEYEAIIASHDAQRAFAASAMFRLAEVRRKQDRKPDAVALYQQLIREFPNAATEVRMARENLSALGAKPDEPATAAPDKERQELDRLKELAKTSPDRLKEPELLAGAVESDWLSVVEYLLDQGADPYGEHGVGLIEACQCGNLAICRRIVEKKGEIPEHLQPWALYKAIMGKRWAVLDYLLDQGIHPDVGVDDGPGSALMCLAKFDFDDDTRKAARHLLDHGANPNAVKKSGASAAKLPTVLHVALKEGRYEMAAFLLENGAKPDLVNDGITLTPLHLAVLNSHQTGTAEIVKKLLECGANPNAVARWAEQGSTVDANPDYHNVTAFQLAVDQGALDIAKLMIARGADLKQPGLLVRYFHEQPFAGERDDPKPYMVNYPSSSADGVLKSDDKGRSARVRFLLEAGADPNLPDTRGFYPISLALLEGNLESLELLLKHGANPNIPFGIMPDSWVEVKTPKNASGEVIKTRNAPGLLNGAIAPEWRVDLQTSVRASMIRMLLAAGGRPGEHSMALARVAARVDDDGSLTRSLLRDVKPAEARKQIDLRNWTPAALNAYKELLLYPALAAGREISILRQADLSNEAVASESADGGVPPLGRILLASPDAFLQTRVRGRVEECRWPEITLIRKSGDTWERTKIDGSGDQPFPDLKWGDVLELRHPGEPTRTAEEDSAMRELFNWHAVRRLSCPITCEQEGKTRKLLLRGDLLTYDPSGSEIPWLSPAQLTRLFVGDGRSQIQGSSEVITIRRKGQPDIKMDPLGQAAEGFKWRENDHLVLPPPRMEGGGPLMGDSGAQLVLSANSGLRAFHVGTSRHPATLVELLAYSCFPFGKGDRVAPNEGNPLSDAACARLRRFIERQPLLIPANPDLAKIRIHRWIDRSRKPEAIEVDLTKFIRSCTDQTPREEARQADVQLQAGDLVELPVTNGNGKAWKGFSQAEMRFFKKVLDGSFSVKRQDGQITENAIDYQQPAWSESSHGLIPLPPERGTASTTTAWLAPESGLGLGLGLNRAMFVRPGSSIIDEGVSQPGRQPRPRVLPPNPIPAPGPERKPSQSQ